VVDASFPGAAFGQADAGYLGLGEDTVGNQRRGKEAKVFGVEQIVLNDTCLRVSHVLELEVVGRVPECVGADPFGANLGHLATCQNHRRAVIRAPMPILSSPVPKRHELWRQHRSRRAPDCGQPRATKESPMTDRQRLGITTPSW
jgi:hypothetical protein